MANLITKEKIVKGKVYTNLKRFEVRLIKSGASANSVTKTGKFNAQSITHLVKNIIFSSSYKSANDDTVKILFDSYIAGFERGNQISVRFMPIDSTQIETSSDTYFFTIRTVRYSKRHNVQTTTISCSTQYFKFNTYINSKLVVQPNTSIKAFFDKVTLSTGFKTPNYSEETFTVYPFSKQMILQHNETIASFLQKVCKTDDGKVPLYFFYVDGTNTIHFEKRVSGRSSNAEYELNLADNNALVNSIDYMENSINKLAAVKAVSNKVQEKQKNFEKYTNVNVEPVTGDINSVKPKKKSKAKEKNQDQTISQQVTHDGEIKDTYIEETTKTLNISLNYIYAPIKPNKLINIKGDFAGIYRVASVRYEQGSNYSRTFLELETSEETKIEKIDPGEIISPFDNLSNETNLDKKVKTNLKVDKKGNIK